MITVLRCRERPEAGHFSLSYYAFIFPNQSYSENIPWNRAKRYLLSPTHRCQKTGWYLEPNSVGIWAFGITMIEFLGMNTIESVYLSFICLITDNNGYILCTKQEFCSIWLYSSCLLFEHVVTTNGDSDDSLTICNTCNHNVVHRERGDL